MGGEFCGKFCERGCGTGLEFFLDDKGSQVWEGGRNGEDVVDDLILLRGTAC